MLREVFCHGHVDIGIIECIDEVSIVSPDGKKKQHGQRRPEYSCRRNQRPMLLDYAGHEYSFLEISDAGHIDLGSPIRRNTLKLYMLPHTVSRNREAAVAARLLLWPRQFRIIEPAGGRLEERYSFAHFFVPTNGLAT